MNTIADNIALSRRYRRRSDRATLILCFAVAGILGLAVWDILWPPRATSLTSTPG
jgi:hypothetical protein